MPARIGFAASSAGHFARKPQKRAPRKHTPDTFSSPWKPPLTECDNVGTCNAVIAVIRFGSSTTAHKNQGSHRPVEHRIGLLVADDLLFVGIEADFAIQLHGDIAQVAKRRRAMADFDRFDGILAALDGLDEIADVVGIVKLSSVLLAQRIADGKMDFIGPDDGIFQRFGMRRSCLRNRIESSLRSLRNGSRNTARP